MSNVTYTRIGGWLPTLIQHFTLDQAALSEDARKGLHILQTQPLRAPELSQPDDNMYGISWVDSEGVTQCMPLTSLQDLPEEVQTLLDEVEREGDVTTARKKVPHEKI